MKRRWDALDIAALVDASLEGFSIEFYGCAWDQLSDARAARILSAILAQLQMLKDAQNETRR